MTHRYTTRPAVRAVRTAAVLLTLVAPLLVAGCAGTDSANRVADSNGNSVPNATAAPLHNGYPFGYW